MANGKPKWLRLDVNMDDKFELVRAEFKSIGFEVIVRLWQKIYGAGYYLEWNEDVALLFANQLGLSGNVVSEIVKCALRRGLFDRSLYEAYGILTSHGIQKRYFEYIKRQKEIEVADAYLLVDVPKIAPNACIIKENVNILTQNASKKLENAGYKTREDKKREENVTHNTHAREERPGSGKGPATSDEPETLLTYARIRSVCQKHAPTIWARTEEKINQNGTALASRLEGTVAEIDWIRNERDIVALFAHAEKTYAARPKYAACDALWVLNNHRKVMATEEDAPAPAKTADKPEAPVKARPAYDEYNARFKV